MIGTSLTASDGLVIAMLATMTFSLGTIGMLLLCMRRNAARRDKDVDNLLEEVAAEEKRAATPIPTDSPEREPWEKEGDWWKQ